MIAYTILTDYCEDLVLRTIRILASITAILAPYTMALTALAFDPPKESYKAIYDTNSSGKVASQTCMAWNGKDVGVLRAVVKGENFRIVSDFKNNKAIIFMDAHKIARPLPLDVEYIELFDMESYKKRSTKDLGTKTVNGHPCHGYLYMDHGVSREVWIGVDCKVVVLLKNPDEGNLLSLKSFEKSPPDSEFVTAIPADYETYIKKPSQETEDTNSK